LRKPKGKLQTNLEYTAARGIVGAIGLFPLAASIKIGESFAKIPFRLLKRLRSVGHRNLELALPELSRQEHERILRGVFASFGRQLGFVSHLHRLTPKKLGEIIEVEGLEYCEQARAAGGGTIIFTAHFGGWELSHSVIAALNYPMNIVVRRIDNPKIESLVGNLRSRFGSRTIDKKESAKAMLRILQKNEFLGILVDLNAQEHEGVFVDFFGVPASTTTGVAKLALRTKSVVLPGFPVWQKEKKRYVLKICEPVEIPDTGNAEENIRILTQNITAKVEEFVRQYPDQWLWIHKRWHTQPKGEKAIY
jgi:KDO2-lipid IV(A) lauroyltransferase